jgi:hypothetical protein
VGWRGSVSGIAAAVTVAAFSAAAAPGADAATGFAPAQTLTGAGPATGTVQTAMASNGYAIAAWVESLAGGESAVRVTTRAPGGQWSAPQQLDAGAATKAFITPISVAVNAVGDAAIAWDDTTISGMTETDSVAVSTSAPGKPFTSALIIAGASDPAVGIDAAGQVSMIDDEGFAETERDWAVDGTAPSAGTALSPAADDCAGVIDAKLAVAADGDAIAGYECNEGITFALRQSGTWTESTPSLFMYEATNTCGQLGGSSDQVEPTALEVGIDEAGNPAAVVLMQIDNSFDCISQDITGDLYLVLASGTSMTPVTPPVDTGQSLEVGNPLSAPTIASAGGSELVAWTSATQGGSSSENVELFNAHGSSEAPKQAVGTGGGGQLIALSQSGYGLDVVPAPSGGGLDAAIKPPGSLTFGTPEPLATASGASVSIDSGGDGLAAYVGSSGSSLVATVQGFEVTPPSFSSVSIPAKATVGKPITFSATAGEFWGPITYAWQFGDGASGSGASVSHTYGAAHTFTVTVTATDPLGNKVSKSASVQVSPPPPVLSKASAKVDRKHHVTFRFTLSEPATVTISLYRLGKHNHRTLVGKLKIAGRKGADHVVIEKLGHHKLAAGKYRASLLATVDGISSRPVAVAVAIGKR